MTRAALYVRISRDTEGESLGVKRQEDDCRKLAESRGWEVVEVYSDNDTTASGKKKRPAWERMLADIEAGQIDTVLAYSSSRMYRRPADLGRLVELAKVKKLDIATVASGTINLDTADGRMIAGILAQVDQGELERIAERVTRKRAELRANGLFLGGHRPFGYRVSDNRLVVDDVEAEYVRQGAAALLNGQSLSSVAKAWNAAGIRTTGGKKWATGHVGLVYSRNLPGIVAPSDLKRIAEARESRHQPKHVRMLLTGLLRCGLCGAQMVGRPTNGTPGYICNATGSVHLRAVAGPLETHVVSWASMRVLDAAGLVDVSSSLQAERDKHEADLVTLAKSDIHVAVLVTRSKMIQARIAAIDEQIEKIEAPVANAAAWEALFTSDEPLANHFDPRDPAARGWLESLVESVTVSPAAKKGRPTFDPGRVSVVWREGVRETA